MTRLAASEGEDRLRAPATLNELFFGAVARYATKGAALRFKAAQRWHDVSYVEFERRVRHLALGLKALGLERGDRVGILSTNRPEWAVSDFACLMIGAVSVPIYPSLIPRQIAHILADSGARALFVENQEQYHKIETIRAELTDLTHIIAFDRLDAPAVVSVGDVARRGEAAEERYPHFRRDALAIEAGRVATIIYTSGTTGPPKGVMLTHGNIASNVAAALDRLRVDARDATLSFLPLSHSFERTAGHFTMIAGGVTINYAEGFHTVAEDLLAVRPTVVISVPRMYEKMYARVLETALRGGVIRRRIFFWARRTAEQWSDVMLGRDAVPLSLALKKRVADRLVFAALRARTGGRIRFFVSGGAPLSPTIARFFLAAGLPILEGYGLTETSPVICVNPYDAPHLGTVGPPVIGVALRIADDGEILVRGPNVMLGYYGQPEATREVLTEDGWLHTGDIGQLDPDGYLSITDRKKDLIITAGGKNIAPQPIENLVKGSAFVHNAVMIADRRRFPIMLVVPDMDAVRAWARERSLPQDDREGLLRSRDVVAKIEREVMITLRDLARYEMPKKILVIKEDFTVERGELTPTLKAKRRVIEEHYKDIIEAAYADDDRPPRP